MALNQDILVEQGTTHTEVYVLEVLSDPYSEYNVDTNPYLPLDITTAAIRMMVRATYDSAPILLHATDTNGKFVKTGVNRFELRLIPSDTSNTKFIGEEIDCVYDIEVELGVNNVIRPVAGSFIIDREVTR